MSRMADEAWLRAASAEIARFDAIIEEASGRIVRYDLHPTPNVDRAHESARLSQAIRERDYFRKRLGENYE